jgi:hypothetical protein
MRSSVAPSLRATAWSGNPQCLFDKSGTGPHPHPATHVSILEWVAGWGPVPDVRMRRKAHSQTDTQPLKATRPVSAIS